MKDSFPSVREKFPKLKEEELNGIDEKTRMIVSQGEMMGMGWMDDINNYFKLEIYTLIKDPNTCH
jgi:hypothetical protein